MSDPNLSQQPPAPTNGKPKKAQPQVSQSVQLRSDEGEKTPEPPTSSEPDPNGPIELRMCRADLVLNHQDNGKALVLGKYVANAGGIDGVVSRLTLYPNGTIIATVSKQRREGDQVLKTDKYIVVRADVECEALT